MSNQEQDFDQSGNDEVIVASGLVDSDLEDSTQETLDSSELVESSLKTILGDINKLKITRVTIEYLTDCTNINLSPRE